MEKNNKMSFLFSLSSLSGEGEELPTKVKYIPRKYIRELYLSILVNVWLIKRISGFLAVTGRH